MSELDLQPIVFWGQYGHNSCIFHWQVSMLIFPLIRCSVTTRIYGLFRIKVNQRFSRSVRSLLHGRKVLYLQVAARKSVILTF